MNAFGHHHKDEMSDKEVIAYLLKINKIEAQLAQDLVDRLPKLAHEHKIRSIFTFQFLNYKFSSMSNAILTVPTGTPVTGFNAAADVKGNALPDSAYLSGSCKYSILPNTDGSPSGATVAVGAREEAFVATEVTPGAASTTIIAFDAQDINGVQLPQSTGTLIFTAAPAVAVGSNFNFDQTSH